MAGQSEAFLIEIIRQGSYAKATAVDPRTGQEASIVGPAAAADAILTRQACNKLQRLLAAAVRPGPGGFSL
ncbi:hypothetical protein VZ95_12215 [Elstera litoralis]|uniref:DUF6898 domain-containing protein n=1 Tax=Elstera litoralis TaxID=552518 RepID=A0A0F3IUP6_9PROT|nr:hypothetical protein [Elstera litoralis]KJV09319.1 hypothetical protein VZ95_12215 [Elstera litoralis]